jgi:hypothetical protein
LSKRVLWEHGIEEHVQIVEDVLPSPAERQLVCWKTSNRVFRLGLTDTDLVTEDLRLPSQDYRSPILAVAFDKSSFVEDDAAMMCYFV